MSGPLLTVLQLLMLGVDGTGIFVCYALAQYYCGNMAIKDLRRIKGLFVLYVYFMVAFIVFIALFISDAMVIAKVPQNWATLPIVRGLTFRLPLTLVGLWVIRKHYTRA